MRLPKPLPLLLCLSLAGCVTPASVATVRAANDFNCDEGKVDVTNIGGNSYRAEGCGQSAVYDCSASDANKGTTTNYTCVPEGSGGGSRGKE